MGWLSNRFGRKKGPHVPAADVAPLDLSVFQIDYHSHLVPAVDDGAPDLAASLDMIDGLVSLGYRGAVTTPHIFPGLYPNTPDTLQPQFDLLDKAVKAHFPSFKLALGAEYYLDPSLLDLIQREEDVLAPGKKLLFELSFAGPPDSGLLREFIFEAQIHGYRPVMAHMERYAYWHHDLSLFEDWAEQGVWLQVNAASLAGAYGPEIQKAAEHCIDKGWVSILGSDAHDIRHIDALAASRIRPAVHQLAQTAVNAQLL